MGGTPTPTMGAYTRYKGRINYTTSLCRMLRSSVSVCGVYPLYGDLYWLHWMFEIHISP